MTSWFEVDKAGLGKLLEKRGKGFALMELVQNAWDESTTRVEVLLDPVPGKPLVHVFVTDDSPEGFKDLSHAFTLFAESNKKGDPEKRGRFNLGEKLVLAMCERASISSTKGEVLFSPNGRSTTRERRERGTEFYGVMRMTREEMAEALEQVRSVIPPFNIETVVNGVQISHPLPVQMGVKATLPTEVADADGFLRKRVRDTTIDIWMPRAGEKAMIYEMGIPIVETGDKYHVSINQKVPLNMDRDNVSPAYLQAVRTAVFNATFDLLKTEDANTPWVRNAAASVEAAAEATSRLMDLRFGDKRVIYDPSDPEANKLAVSKGYTVIHGGSLSQGEWDNVRKTNAALPAGKVTPSPKPFSPDGKPLKMMDVEDYTPEMKQTDLLTQHLAHKLLGTSITVRFANDSSWPFAATYGKGSGLIFNIGRLGYQFFESAGDSEEFLALVIHEFGHHYSHDHLAEEYHDALCKLGARLYLEGKQ